MKKKMVLVVGVLLLFSAACLANTLKYEAFLAGSSEAPPNASPGTGFAQVIIDDIANTMEVKVTFSGLLGTTTASHIHCCTASPGTGTAGVATVTPTFTGFPSGVTSGTYDHTFDLTSTTSWNSAYISANGGTPVSAESALLAGIAAGNAYLNIHTTVVPGGEIRGFLTPAPEPSSFSLLIAAIPGWLALRRSRK